MPGENEIERVRGNSVDDPREMAEQDVEAASCVHEQVRLRALAVVALRVDADELDRLSPHSQRLGAIAEKHRVGEVTQLGRARERVARDSDVMVTENDEWTVELRQEWAQETLSAGMRHEVTRHAHDVWLPLDDPADCRRGCTIPARESCAEVEVGEVADSETLQIFGKSGDCHLDHAGAEPPCLDPAVGKYEHEGANGQGKREDGGHVPAP
jgi:hypothetical protein